MLAEGALVERRRLSTPGGVIDHAQVFWHPDQRLWGFFSDSPLSGTRWACWFGTDLGGRTLFPAVEINIPTGRQMVCTGQVVADAAGRLHLAHKGILGGGRKAVRAQDFAAEIRGFSRQAVLAGGTRRILPWFVLGALGDGGLKHRLAAFVGECRRIRELRRSLSQGRTLRRGAEPMAAGALAGPRRHQMIQNALANALRQRGHMPRSGPIGTVWPDLYLCAPDGRMGVLFEIKADAAAQSLFTAIGQLIVYGAGQPVPPRRVLVVHSVPAEPLFHEALRRTGIDMLRYDIDEEGRVSFPDLGRMVPAKIMEDA